MNATDLQCLERLQLPSENLVLLVRHQPVASGLTTCIAPSLPAHVLQDAAPPRRSQGGPLQQQQLLLLSLKLVQVVAKEFPHVAMVLVLLLAVVAVVVVMLGGGAAEIRVGGGAQGGHGANFGVAAGRLKTKRGML